MFQYKETPMFNLDTKNKNYKFNSGLTASDFYLDHFELENVDFIKIDVESYEYFVIDGARKTLEKNSPVIMIEFIEKYEHPEFTVNETKFLLDQLGYISVGYVDRDWVYIKE